MRRMTVALLAASMAGLGTSCGVKEETLPDSGNSLRGKVTFGGQPVPFAAIVIAGGGSGGASVLPDGTYLAGNLPLGEVKIGVDTDAARGEYQSVMMAASYKGPEAAGKAKAVPKFVAVPHRYADPETSGLRTAIRAGSNTFDIDIPK